MAISTLVRRTVSSMVLLVLPAIKARGSHLSTLVSPLQIRPAQEIWRETFYLSSAFSSIAKKTRYDADLLPFIESEIKCAEESDNHDQKDEVPDRFPFEIQDNPGQQTVTLRREYGSEIIIVEVHMPGLVTGEDGGGNDDDDDSRSSQSSIPLVVSVSKGDGPSLEFGCTAYPDEVAIDSMSVKEQETSEDQIAYEGPDFSDLDENLQKAFHKYLEIRGIKSSTTNFLHEYMINKDSREYLTWLKNVKKFIEK